MATPQQLTIQTPMSQDELEAELNTAWSILKKDPKYAKRLREAGTPAETLPANRSDAIAVQPTGSNLVPPLLTEFVIGVLVGLTVEGVKILIEIIRHRKGDDAVK